MWGSKALDILFYDFKTIAVNLKESLVSFLSMTAEGPRHHEIGRGGEGVDIMCHCTRHQALLKSIYDASINIFGVWYEWLDKGF